MILQEIFDSQINNLLQKTSWGWHGAFSWDENIFSVQLVKRSVQQVPDNLNCFEASFFLQNVPDDDAFSSVDKSKQIEIPVKVYGVVLNSLLEIWATNDIDVVYFSAEPRHSADKNQYTVKKQIYNTLARRAQRQGGGYLYVNHSYFSSWILSKVKIADDYWTSVLREGFDELLRSGYKVQSV